MNSPAFEQLFLDFPKTTSYDKHSFVVTPCNHYAYQFLMAPEQWGSFGMILKGPDGCGKTHLAHIWRQQTNARFITLAMLQHDLSFIADGVNAVIIDPIEKLIAFQERFFHLLNILREQQKTILLTTHETPHSERYLLKDLLTRLRSFPIAIIDPPDDLLSKAIIIKRFSDLQLYIDDRIISYLLIRSERSYATLHRLIDQIYYMATFNKQKVTLSLIRSIL